MPIFIAPESKDRVHKTKWDYVGLFGTVLSIFVGTTTLLSPLVRRHAITVANTLTPILKKMPKNRKLQQADVQSNLLTLLQDKKRLEILLKKMFMATLFVQNINKYETAYNSKQPSLMLQVLGQDIFSIFSLWKWKDGIFLLMQPLGIFYTLGKRNDIENNVHPEKRRDWDMARIKHFFVRHKHEAVQARKKTFLKEIKSFFHFVADDIRLTLSLEAWKQLFQNYQKLETWNGSIPGNVGSNLLWASWLFAIASFFSKKKLFGYLSAITLLLPIIFNQVSYATRALRNKTELDGLLVLGSIPPATLGQIFLPQIFPNLYPFYGLSNIGITLQTLGFNINAKRYRAQVEEMQWLAEQSKQFPNLTAGDVLTHFKTNLAETEKLRKKLGKSRVDYLFKLLEKAETARLNHNISLETFLAPALTSIDTHPHKAKIRK